MNDLVVKRKYFTSIHDDAFFSILFYFATVSLPRLSITLPFEHKSVWAGFFSRLIHAKPKSVRFWQFPFLLPFHSIALHNYWIFYRWLIWYAGFITNFFFRYLFAFRIELKTIIKDGQLVFFFSVLLTQCKCWIEPIGETRVFRQRKSWQRNRTHIPILSIVHLLSLQNIDAVRFFFFS